jgi:hypothetical protein
MYYDEYNIDHDYLTMTSTSSLPRHRHQRQRLQQLQQQTPANNIRIITSIHDTPTVTLGGKREEATKWGAVIALCARPIQ